MHNQKKSYTSFQLTLSNQLIANGLEEHKSYMLNVRVVQVSTLTHRSLNDHLYKSQLIAPTAKRVLRAKSEGVQLNAPLFKKVCRR